MIKILISVLILLLVALSNSQLTFKNNCPHTISVFSEVNRGAVNPWQKGQVILSGQEKELNIGDLLYLVFKAVQNDDPRSNGTLIMFFFDPNLTGYAGKVSEIDFNYAVQILPDDLTCSNITCKGSGPSDECYRLAVQSCKVGAKYLITYCYNQST